MSEDRIERETLIAAPLERVWSLVAQPGFWVADKASLPGTVAKEGESMMARNAEHGDFPVRVEKVEPPTYLAYRWTSAFPGEELREDNSTLVEFTLTPEGEQTRLRVVEQVRGAGRVRGAAQSEPEGPHGRLAPGARRAQDTRRTALHMTEERPGAAEVVDSVLGALADPTRRQLLDLLAAQDEATATTLAERLPVSRQAVVKHLAVLEAAGLVSGGRVGREVRYAVRPAALDTTARWMASLAAYWDRRLANIKRVAEAAERDPSATRPE